MLNYKKVTMHIDKYYEILFMDKNMYIKLHLMLTDENDNALIKRRV